jgi:hypothetical protein
MVWNMDQDRILRVNTPAVIGEVIDGDVVLINFDTGTYYLLGGAGAEIWPLLEQGATPAVIEARLREVYALADGDIRPDLDRWLEELVSEHLIAPGEPSPGDPAPDLPAATEAGEYAPPTLSRFDDMQEMLLLDPIHDVAETGWPHRPADPD